MGRRGIWWGGCKDNLPEIKVRKREKGRRLRLLQSRQRLPGGPRACTARSKTPREGLTALQSCACGVGAAFLGWVKVLD